MRGSQKREKRPAFEGMTAVFELQGVTRLGGNGYLVGGGGPTFSGQGGCGVFGESEDADQREGGGGVWGGRRRGGNRRRGGRRGGRSSRRRRGRWSHGLRSSIQNGGSCRFWRGRRPSRG